MAALKQVTLFKATNISYQTLRNFHVNQIVYSIKWRRERKLSENPNKFGPLTNLPDYSFKDGRPTPFGANQKRRIDEQREQLIRMKELISEVDNAVINHERRLKAIEDEKQKILGRKLKAKGDNLLAGGPEVLRIAATESEGKDSKLLTSDTEEKS